MHIGPTIIDEKRKSGTRWILNMWTNAYKFAFGPLHAMQPIQVLINYLVSGQVAFRQTIYSNLTSLLISLSNISVYVSYQYGAEPQWIDSEHFSSAPLVDWRGMVHAC